MKIIDERNKKKKIFLRYIYVLLKLTTFTE